MLGSSLHRPCNKYTRWRAALETTFFFLLNFKACAVPLHTDSWSSVLTKPHNRKSAWNICKKMNMADSNLGKVWCTERSAPIYKEHSECGAAVTHRASCCSCQLRWCFSKFRRGRAASAFDPGTCGGRLSLISTECGGIRDGRSKGTRPQGHLLTCRQQVLQTNSWVHYCCCWFLFIVFTESRGDFQMAI